LRVRLLRFIQLESAHGRFALKAGGLSRDHVGLQGQQGILCRLGHLLARRVDLFHLLADPDLLLLLGILDSRLEDGGYVPGQQERVRVVVEFVRLVLLRLVILLGVVRDYAC
jgi:hypothetical protein